MPLEKITQVFGTAVVVPGHDIDTDRIIPARFMKCVTFDGLGEYLFHDVRFDKNEQSKNIRWTRTQGCEHPIFGAQLRLRFFT